MKWKPAFEVFTGACALLIGALNLADKIDQLHSG